MAGPFGILAWGPVRGQDGHMHVCGNIRGKCHQEATDQRCPEMSCDVLISVWMSFTEN